MITDLLPRPVLVDSITAGGDTHVVTATVDECAQIAESLDLLDLKGLTATMTISRSNRGRLTLSGRLQAEIVQACVVTLDPVSQTIDALIKRVFVPVAKSHDTTMSGVLDVVPEGDDPPETYDSATIDLGLIVAEELVLAIDPYPRSEGAELVAGDRPEPDDASESPFAVLKSLGQGSRS